MTVELIGNFANPLASRRALMVACATCAFVSGPALAQNVGPPSSVPAAAASESDSHLQEIVVTAQKRSQNLQDTPLSITAATGKTLQQAGITNVATLGRIEPSLQVSAAGGILETFVRGIGNPTTTAGDEASVPIYIDDVYYVRAAQPFFDLANIDHVEILKGPQGTLFGRNASGGVISIYTRDPGQVTDVEGKIGYGNFDTVSGQFYASTPLTDRLASDISISGLHQGAGWGRNLVTGQGTYKDKYISLRSKSVWKPTDSTTVKLIGYFQSSRNEQGIYSRTLPGTLQGTPDGAHQGFPIPPSYPNPSQLIPYPGFYNLDSSFNEYDQSKGYGGSVQVIQNTPLADLVSITALRRNKEMFLSEGDFSQYNFTAYALHVLDHQFTQELQVKSKPGSKLTWILGGFYMNALQGFDPTRISGEGPAAAGIDYFDITGIQRAKSYAAFGQATYPILKDTNITVGLRYTKDELAGRGTQDATFFPGVPGVGGMTIQTQSFSCTTNPDDCRKTFNKITYKAALDHHFDRNVMAYASISRGYKAGVFNTLPLTSAAIKPEVVDAYEVGLKSELFDRKLRLNVALFWNDIKNSQVQANTGTFVALTNAATARTRGVEVDASAALAEGLTARLSGTYLDARFRSFPGCQSYAYSPTAPGNLDQIITDCSGNRMPNASKWKGSVGLNYARQVDGAGKFALDIAANYTGAFFFEANNLDDPAAHLSTRQGAYTLVDGSIMFTPEAFEKISVRLWAKNILGEKYNIDLLTQANGAAFASAPAAPRTFGVELGFKF